MRGGGEDEGGNTGQWRFQNRQTSFLAFALSPYRGSTRHYMTWCMHWMGFDGANEYPPDAAVLTVYNDAHSTFSRIVP